MTNLNNDSVKKDTFEEDTSPTPSSYQTPSLPPEETSLDTSPIPSSYQTASSSSGDTEDTSPTSTLVSEGASSASEASSPVLSEEQSEVEEMEKMLNETDELLKDGKKVAKIKPKNLFMRIVTSTPFAMILAGLLAILLVKFIGFPTHVSGESMYPTLRDNQFVIVNRLYKDIERNDIIVARADNMYIIKRVIGLPNETIQIIDGTVYVDGKICEEDKKKNIFIEDSGYFTVPITLDDDEYFVLGDNRNNSKDSTELGPITKDNITGKAIVKEHK